MIEILITFIVQQIFGYAINKGVDRFLKINQDSYHKKLASVIDKTIDVFSSSYPITEKDGKFPFYHSQVIINELLKYRFFKNDDYQLDENGIKQELLTNPNILTPKDTELERFLQIFEENLKAEKTLESLAVEENYKSEIFEISQKFTPLFEQLDRVEKNTEDIKKILKDKVGRTGETPKELTDVHRRSKDDIIGREDYLKRIRKDLLNGRETILMNGMGGIGKTTLAEVYVEFYYNEYKHIAWLSIEDSFKDACLSNYALLRNLGLEGGKPDQQFNTCLNELRIMKGPNLLVIDNAKLNLSDYYHLLPKAPDWHVLITSRVRIEPFNIIDIDFLTVPDAIALFKKYCTYYSDEQIQRVVNKVELHTLTIEVLAKAAKRNHWSIEKTFEALGIDAIVDVSVQHFENKKIDKIKSYLIEIFNASELNEREKWVLTQFIALPSVDIDYHFLYKLLQIEKLDWKDNFSATLEGLYETGFLQKNKKKKSYKLHAVLNEVLQASLNASFDDIRSLFETVMALLYTDQAKDNPIDKFPFVSFGDAILELFSNQSDPDLSHLQFNLANVYQDLGDYEKARDLLETALKSDLKNFGDKHPTIATYQSNLAGVYKDLGDY
ncbi:MAG: tetratricopeptide repeat protein, partial [Candidatus Marinimicrobia bacterium]|nr:tetratricopeptide repeat protein [Candidatus Neomarinimicrobiota bacterium]